MSRTIIAPLIAVVALLVKNAFGFEIGAEGQNALIDVCLLGVTLYGVIKNHKKVGVDNGKEGDKEA